MKKNQFIFVLITTLVSVIFLSTVWEFWLEGFISGIFFDDHEAEPLNVRLEYIISITIFVILSLIFPAIAGFKLIENDEKIYQAIIEEIYFLGELLKKTKYKYLLGHSSLNQICGYDCCIISLNYDSSFHHNLYERMKELFRFIQQTTAFKYFIYSWENSLFFLHYLHFLVFLVKKYLLHYGTW